MSGRYLPAFPPPDALLRDSKQCVGRGRSQAGAWERVENEYVVHNGHIYGLDDGILCCLGAATGKRVWKKGCYGYGQMLLLPEQERIIVLCESGEVVLVATKPKELEEVAKFPAIQGKTWNHPVLAHGKLFVRNAEEMACFDVAP